MGATDLVRGKMIVADLESRKTRGILNDRDRPHKLQDDCDGPHESQGLKGAWLYKMGKGKIVRNFYEPALEGRFYGNITKITLEERMYL